MSTHSWLIEYRIFTGWPIFNSWPRVDVFKNIFFACLKHIGEIGRKIVNMSHFGYIFLIEHVRFRRRHKKPHHIYVLKYKTYYIIWIDNNVKLNMLKSHWYNQNIIKTYIYFTISSLICFLSDLICLLLRIIIWENM